MEASRQPSPEVTEVLGRALLDDEFRTALFDNPDTTLASLDLSDADRELLKSIPKQDFEQHAQSFREGSVVGATVGVGIGARGTFQEDESTKPEA